MPGRLYSPTSNLALLQITTASLPNATLSSAYSVTLTGVGGLAPYTWILLSAWPNTGNWLSLSSSGVLSGTPGTAETETVAVLLKDVSGNTTSAYWSFNVSASTPAFIPNSGFTISAPSGYGDTQLITITGPPGSFGTKPNGAKINYLARYGYGYNPQAGIQDPLSRTSWSDSFWPLTGATGPSSGLPGLQTTTKAPGSSNAFATVLPGAAVITGTLTNGSANVTGCTNQGVAGATPFASINYGFGGIAIGNPSNGWAAITNPSQSSLGSGIIQMTTPYSGTSGTYTLQIAYGPDQLASPRPLIVSPTQDQIFAFRGLNNYPWRSSDYNFQNNKFLRGFTRSPGLGTDLWWNTDGNLSDLIVGIYNEGTTKTQASQYFLFNGGQQYKWTQNQWFQHTVWYHGNTTSSSTDGGLIHIGDSTLLFGTLGIQPNMGAQFWGSGGTHPTSWDFNDIACRISSPYANDTCYTDYTMYEDSACCVQIGSGNSWEMQWPTVWTSGPTQDLITFAMHRSYLDATVGGGSLTGLSLTVQKSNYARVSCGSFTAFA